MFTKEDYATLTASQRRFSVRSVIAKKLAFTVVTVVAVNALANAVEKKLDSSEN